MTVLFSLTAALFAAVFNVASKRCVSGRRWSPFSFTLSYSVVTGLLSLLLLPFLPGEGGGLWPGPIVTSLLLLLGHTLLAMALAKGDASTIAPLLGLKSIFVPVVAVLFTEERVSAALWAAALLSVAGIYLLNATDAGDEGGRRRSRLWNAGVLLMVGCTVSYAFGDNWIRVSQQGWHPLRYYCVAQGTFGTLCAALLVLGISLRRGGTAALVVPRPLPWRPLLVAAAGSWLSQLFLWVSFRLADAVTLPNIVMSTRGLLTILLILALARLGRAEIAGEYQSRRVYLQRLAGASLMVAALAIAIIT